VDSHAETGALTPNVDWIKCCFSVVFSCYLPPLSISHQSALGIKADVCMRIRPYNYSL